MSRFIQLHALTCYPPSNPNRDDTGRPKTATVGGHSRLRISSQAIKRAIRTFPSFRDKLEGAIGVRTKRLGTEVILEALGDPNGADVEKVKAAEAVVKSVASLDAGQGKAPALSDQLVFMTKHEIDRAIGVAREIASGERSLPTKAGDIAKKLVPDILLPSTTAVDVAMFGRMLTGSDNHAQGYSIDAACQVSHAFTTHRCEVEDDFFSALDDLGSNQASAHVDEAGFASGVFYVYACINRDLLEANLDGDAALAARAIDAFVEAFALATPSGKKNSFANHTAAEFLLVQKGEQHPRSLAMAFQRKEPARQADEDLMTASIAALGATRAAFAAGYGADCASDRFMNIRAADMPRPDQGGPAPFAEGAASLADLIAFAAAPEGFA